MNIAKTISYLYPTAVHGENFTVDMTDTGPELTRWDEVAIGAPVPTEAELIAAWPETARQIKKSLLPTVYRAKINAGLSAFDADDVQNAMIDIVARAVKIIAQNTMSGFPQADKTALLALNANLQKAREYRAAMETIHDEIEAATDPDAVDVENSSHWPTT